MTRSMTGIGESRVIHNEFDINVIIRSVNHRFLNLQIRLPRGYHRYETTVREMLSRGINRGKIDVTIDFYALPAHKGDVVINRGYSESLCREIIDLAKHLDIPHGLTAERLIRFSDVMTSPAATETDPELERVLCMAVDRALEDFQSARLAEGTHLVNEMRQRVLEIIQMLGRIRDYASKQPAVVRERLDTSIQTIHSNLDVDSKRLEEEVVLWAVRCDVTEEITRLESHLNRMLETLNSDRPIGKELDFLIQELHREANTIASKSVIQEINRTAVTLKLEIEKLREQVQNLE